MSQVRNLRAMFEGKGEESSNATSPGPTAERRGRSPAGATTPTPGANAAEVPRPLSKVRTNFVAVEKDGRIGLQRNQSSDSNLSRNLSVPDAKRADSTSREPRSRTPRKMFGSPPITESSADPFDAAALTDKPSTNPDKQVDAEESGESLLPAEPKPDTEANEKQPPAVAGKSASKAPAKPTTKPSAPRLSTAKRTDVSKTSAPAASTSTSRASRASDVFTRPTAASLSKKHEPLKTSQSATGFVKPKPKSPTKPVHLPSTLTAPTASSSSKGARASLTQSASTGSLGGQPSNRTSLATAARPVKRQPATATSTRGRPSIGLPPGKKSEPTERKKEGSVDEGFLARMMRPTQASSSKTSDKAAIASPPPKRAAARSSISGVSHPATKATSVVSSQRSTQSRSPAQRVKSQLSNEPEKDTTVPEPTAVADVAVPSSEVEPPQEPEPVADEPALVSDEPTQSQTVAEAIPDVIPEAEPTDEVVEQVAHAETAEEAIDIAQEADLVQDPVEPEPESEHVSESVAQDEQIIHEQQPEPAAEEIHAEEELVDEPEEEAHAEAAHEESEEAQEAQATEIDIAEPEATEPEEAEPEEAEPEIAETGAEDDKKVDLTQKLTAAAEEAVVTPSETVTEEIADQMIPIAHRASSKHESADSNAAEDLANLKGKSGLELPAESTKTEPEEEL